MKITIEFKVATPIGAVAVLNALKKTIIRGYSPMDWDRPTTHVFQLTEEQVNVTVTMRVEEET